MAQRSHVLKKSFGSLCRDIFSALCYSLVLETLLQLIDRRDSSLPAWVLQLSSHPSTDHRQQHGFPARSSTTLSEPPWHRDTQSQSATALQKPWLASGAVPLKPLRYVTNTKGCLSLFNQMKALVEVMNTALFYRKAQLLELVLVKWVVCKCVHLCMSCAWLSVI